jgi:hypothetical protein
MGEGITGFVSAKSGTTTVTIYIRGKISRDCLEALKTLIKNWAGHCGLTTNSVKVALRTLKKKKR